MKIKICTKCNKEKSLSEFHKYKASPDGCAYWCKSCKKKVTREYYERNKTKVIQQAKKWREKHEQYMRKYMKEYHENYGKQYYLDNKDKINKASKEWRLKNPGYIKKWRVRNSDYDSKWYMSNREKCKISNQKWCKKNKNKNCDYAARYRARKMCQTLRLSIEEQNVIDNLYAIAECMNKASINVKWHVDHIIPLSKGGLHHPNNLQILEASANLSKGDKLLKCTKM